MRIFPTHLHREVKEEFDTFVFGLDECEISTIAINWKLFF